MSKLCIVNCGAAVSAPILLINRASSYTLHYLVRLLLWVPIISKSLKWILNYRLQKLYGIRADSPHQGLVLLHSGITDVSMDILCARDNSLIVVVNLDKGTLTWNKSARTWSFQGPAISLVDQPTFFGDIQLNFSAVSPPELY